jgi:5-methylcytosine-specific restriction endonuclease McrA
MITQARTRKRRANSATQKLENFRYRCAGPGRATSTQTPRKNRQNLVTHFIRNRPGAPLLTLKEVVERHPQPQCYLTGRNLSWEEPTKISFDHIVPTSRGGTSTLDNLGITCRPANQAKTDLMLDEFLTLCQEVLEHHGASVIWDTHE